MDTTLLKNQAFLIKAVKSIRFENNFAIVSPYYTTYYAVGVVENDYACTIQYTISYKFAYGDCTETYLGQETVS